MNKFGILAAIIFAAIVAGCFVAIPYNLEAEKLNAQAEIERAKGAAEAIKIENGSITPAYIQYLWVRQQSNLNDKTVIYIPTETNLPVLEASRNK